MRIIAAAAIAALALAACNQNNSQSAQSSATTTTVSPPAPGGGLFPDMTSVSYRLEATISHDGHSRPIVMIRSGHKMRMEMSSDQGQQTMIMDPDSQQNLLILNQGGHLSGMRMANMATPDVTAAWREQMGGNSHRAGDCSVAGEHGQVWEHVDEGGANPRAFCVTSDGIPLRGTDNGAVVFEASSVQRGPQSADLFQAPAGVRIMEINANAAAAAAAAMAKMRQAQHQ